MTIFSDKNYIQFKFFFIATLVLSDFFCTGREETINLLLYAVSYLLSFTILEKFAKQNDFYPPLSAELADFFKDTIKFGESEIEASNNTDSEENRFFKIIDPSKMTNRKIFSILLILLIAFVVHKLGLNFTLKTSGVFFYILLINSSATIGHLLLALYLSAFYVVITGVGQENLSTKIIPGVLYLFFFTTTLHFFHLTSLQSFLSNFPELVKSIWKKEKIISNILKSCMGLILCFILANTILPKSRQLFHLDKILSKVLGQSSKSLQIPSPPTHQKEQLINALKNLSLNIETFAQQGSHETLNEETRKLKNETNQLIKQIHESNTPTEESLKEAQRDLENLGERFNQQIDQGELLDKKSYKGRSENIENLENLSKGLNNISRDGNAPNFDKNGLDNLVNQLDQLGQSAEKVPRDLEAISKEVFEKSKERSSEFVQAIDNKMNTLLDENNHLKTMIRSQKEKLLNIKNSSPPESAVLKEELKESNQTLSKKLEEFKGNVRNFNEWAQKQTMEENRKNIKFEIPKIVSSKDDNKQQKVITPIQTNKIQQLEKFIRFTGLAFLFLTVLYFIKKFFKKTKIEKISKIELSDGEKRELKDSLSDLKRNKLSPKEEIIQYYIIIQKTIKSLYYKEVEPPPPLELYHQFSPKHVNLAEPFQNITEILCDTVYGDKKITKESLKIYRKSVFPLLKFFGV